MLTHPSRRHESVADPGPRRVVVDHGRRLAGNRTRCAGEKSPRRASTGSHRSGRWKEAGNAFPYPLDRWSLPKGPHPCWARHNASVGQAESRAAAPCSGALVLPRPLIHGLRRAAADEGEHRRVLKQLEKLIAIKSLQSFHHAVPCLGVHVSHGFAHGPNHDATALVQWGGYQPLP